MRRLLLSLVLLVGCGKAEEKPAPAPAPSSETPAAPRPEPAQAAPAAPAEPPADDRCEFTVEGDVTAKSVTGGGPMTVGTDYWQTKDELKRAMGMMVKDPAKLEEAMKKDPVLYTLILNCGRGDDSINFIPANGSRYADVPFGPKKYAIRTRQAKPGEMGAMIQVQKVFFGGEGTFEITRFDKSGIAGTFEADLVEQTFGAKTEGKKAKLKGSFNLKCSFPSEICKEGAGK